MIVPPLDPRFGKLVALMRSSTYAAEQASAERKAGAIAKAAGLTFEKALAIHNYYAVRAANPNNPFAGFDDYQEITNPGHLERMRARRLEKRRLRQQWRAALVERHGSLDAVLAPCARETLLLKAVKPWRTASKPPHQRWTKDLKGWNYIDSTSEMPKDLRAAIEGAYPMPASLAEAQAELAYWRKRDTDMQHALSEDGGNLGDYGLDKVGVARMQLVQDGVDHDIKLATLPEILERFRVYRDDDGGRNERIEDAIFRDLEAMAGADR